MTSDKDMIQKITSAISSSIVEHLLASQDLLNALISTIVKDAEFEKALDNGRQEIYDSLSLDLEKSAGNIKTLQDHCTNLEETISKLESEIDQQQQYSRRNCLLVHGIAESDSENTDELVRGIFEKQLNVTVEEPDIDRSHRIGKRKKDKHRPIIVKFTSYNKRRKVFNEKRQLKGSGVVITESLTARRVALLGIVKKNQNFQTTWTVDGRITGLLSNGNKIVIEKESDLMNLSSLTATSSDQGYNLRRGR